MSTPVTALHHLALGAEDVERVASFYRDLLGLAELDRQVGEDGALRSIWLSLGCAGHAVLMIERLAAAPATPSAESRERPGLFLLAVRAPSAEDRDARGARLERAGYEIEERSEHTLYFRDPEGNRVAISTHPLAGSAG